MALLALLKEDEVKTGTPRQPLRCPATAGRRPSGAGAQRQPPPRHWQHARLWETLGYLAFIAMALAYWLMVNKPPLWT